MKNCSNCIHSSLCESSVPGKPACPDHKMRMANLGQVSEEIIKSKDFKLAPKMAREEKKDRMSLIPMDILRDFLLPAYEEGLIKYERESWRRGFKISELIDAADRHKESFMYRMEDFDPEAYEKFGIMKHHLAGAIFSLVSALHTLEYHPELDDRRSPSNGTIPPVVAYKAGGYLPYSKEMMEEKHGKGKQGGSGELKLQDKGAYGPSNMPVVD